MSAAGNEQLIDAHRRAAEEETVARFLEKELRDLWGLGRNIFLACAPCPEGLQLLVIPHYMIADFATQTTGSGSPTNVSPSEYIGQIISSSKVVSQEKLDEISGYLGVKATLLPLPGVASQRGLEADAIENIVKRFSISYVADRAVALFDIVGFSLLPPLEQVTQLNSLSFSVNSAYSKMLSKEIDLSFARTTTGDGFYIWNRDTSLQANINLYHFLHLVLADNAIAQSKSRGRTTPVLRTCFHIGDHYEFYQSEGLSPTIYSYIVGDVTIELARMIDEARPNQVLIGDFKYRSSSNDSGESVELGVPEFIEESQSVLSDLHGLELSGERITSIKCYLTGETTKDGTFGISRYRIIDKHGKGRYVYNAKDNIYRSSADPIFLGLPNDELSDFGASVDKN